MSIPSRYDPWSTDQRPPDWFVQLGLSDPEKCAASLVSGADHDPFHVIGFVSLSGSCLGTGFGDLVESLADYEPRLQSILPAVAATMPILPANDRLPDLTDLERAELPAWLRHIGDRKCSGILHRYDLADRRSSSYLIETQLADGQRATGRVSICHGEVDRVGEFWTTGLTLGKAARFYRKRYALHTTRRYRSVAPATAAFRVRRAIEGSIASGEFLEDLEAPIPWPQNLPVLNLMLEPALALLDE